MAIIVAGKLIIKSGFRSEFISKSRAIIEIARNNSDCEDFAVSEDPVDLDRVNIFEKWKTKNALEEFRHSGPDSDVFSLVDLFLVNEYEIS